MTCEGWRKFKRLLEDPEAPILVQNVTDAPISWQVYRDQNGSDWKTLEHWNRICRDLRIEPREIVNLRELLHEEAFHSNMTIPWLIEAGRLMVLNDHYGNSPDPFEDEEIQPFLKAMKNPPPQRTSRYYAIAAQRIRNGRKDYR